MDESNQTNDKTYSQYTPRDVLCGRGKSLDAHSGNRAFRVMMRDQSEFYENATRQEKGRMLLLLSDEMRAKGVRFLKKDSMGLWQELDADGMKQKIGHAVRDVARPARKKSAGAIKPKTMELMAEIDPIGVDRQGPNFVAQVLHDIQVSKMKLLADAVAMPAPTITHPYESSTNGSAHSIEEMVHSLTTATCMAYNASGQEQHITGNDDTLVQKLGSIDDTDETFSLFFDNDPISPASRNMMLGTADKAAAKDSSSSWSPPGENGQCRKQSTDSDEMNSSVEQTFQVFQNDSGDTHAGVVQEDSPGSQHDSCSS